MDRSESIRTDEQFRRLIESVPDAHVFVDRTSRIVLVNEQAEALFGYARGELEGAPLLRLIPPRLRHRVPLPDSPTWKAAQRGRNRLSLCVLTQRKDGSEFVAEISIRALDTGHETLFAAAIRDVSRRGDGGEERDKEKLLQHLSELAHVSRLSTMGEMVAGLAHELNQPLYAIGNYARACQELLRPHPDLHADMADIAEKLTRQTERAAEIVRRLRRFASRREPRRSAVDVNALVREVQQLMLFHAHRFSITTRLDLAPDLPPVLGDAILIEQVLVNLLRNAFEAMSEAQCPHPVVTVRTAADGGGLIAVTVTDNGPGFGEATTDQLFQAFYTTKEQGMGLGLVISRSIIEAHGGRLTAAPNPDGGALFQLTLPPCPAP